MSVARWIDVILGTLFVVLGIWGLLLGSAPVLGVLPFNVLLGTGIIIAGTLLLVGATSTETARSAAGLVGVVFALAGLTGIFSQTLFGLIPGSAWTIGLLLVTGAVLLYDWLAVPERPREIH